MRWIVVFDTHVLFSGLGWRGTPYRCLELARAGIIAGITCREVLDELVEKLATKLRFSPEQITDTIGDLLTFLRLARCPFRKSCASVLLGTPGSSPAPEATLERGAPRDNPGELVVYL